MKYTNKAMHTHVGFRECSGRSAFEGHVTPDADATHFRLRHFRHLVDEGFPKVNDVGQGDTVTVGRPTLEVTGRGRRKVIKALQIHLGKK